MFSATCIIHMLKKLYIIFVHKYILQSNLYKYRKNTDNTQEKSTDSLPPQEATHYHKDKHKHDGQYNSRVGDSRIAG